MFNSHFSSRRRFLIAISLIVKRDYRGLNAHTRDMCTRVEDTDRKEEKDVRNLRRKLQS